MLATEQTRDGKFIITAESRRDTTRCGVRKQELPEIWSWSNRAFAHLPILGQETYIEIAATGTMHHLSTCTDNDTNLALV
ncbi:MAG: hypothetical protein R3E31_16595 [Chloroflexota bacterium]